MEKLKHGKKAMPMAKTVWSLLLPYKGEKLKTITTDNGSEFVAHEWIALRLGLDIYFTDTYCSWQKGAIENTNKLIRQYIMDDYTEISLQELHETVGRLRYKTIVFESCNMGGIEYLYQFHDICDFIIASSTELLSPGFLPLYRQGIGSLADREGAFSFAQRYASHVKNPSFPIIPVQ